MKDVSHHLRYVQKKVIQAARKNETPPEEPNGKPVKPAEKVVEKKNPAHKFDPNHRTPRILKRIGVY